MRVTTRWVRRHNAFVDDSQPALREQRFSQILEENRDRIGRIARVYARHHAEDLIQEILLQIWKSLPCFDEQAKLSTWCYRIALNTAISWRRNATRLKRRPPKNRVESETIADCSSKFSDEAQLLEKFLSSLSEIDRAVLLMFLEDLSNQEIAETMGVSNGAVRTRISRIRDRLKSWEESDG